MTEDTSLIQKVQTDIEQHGEVHATFEDIDEEVELRQGTAEFDDDVGVITLESSSQVTERFGYERLVSWYLPENRRD